MASPRHAIDRITMLAAGVEEHASDDALLVGNFDVQPFGVWIGCSCRYVHTVASNLHASCTRDNSLMKFMAPFINSVDIYA